MPFLVKETSSQFEPAPEGLQQAVCVDIVDLGMVKTEFGDKHMVRIVWQVPTVAKTGERHQVAGRYTVSLHKKAKLRQHLEMWRGKAFTGDELKGFDLEKLLGANCQMQVVHNVADEGRVYANVQAIVPCLPTMKKLEPLNFVRFKDRPKDGSGAVAAGEPEGDGLPF